MATETLPILVAALDDDGAHGLALAFYHTITAALFHGLLACEDGGRCAVSERQPDGRWQHSYDVYPPRGGTEECPALPRP